MSVSELNDKLGRLASSREEIIFANPIVDFMRDRGYVLMRAGENFVTSDCPMTQHKRGHRPVMIYPGTQSWWCHDCKVGGSVIDWEVREKHVSAADAMRMLGGGNNGSSEKKIVATYNYTDEAGNLLFQCVRFQPKDFRQRQSDGKGGWIWNLEGVRRVLYRLPQIISAQIVATTEGEKDADNLTKLGIVATTNSGGAGKWRSDYSEALRGKDVVIFGDDDEPGRAHVDQVIESLTGKAMSIKRVMLPEGCHDVSDYIDSLPADKAAESIAKLIDATPVLSSVNSLNSLARSPDGYAVVDDFPEPLSEVAFQGLAGDIVRRIEPHTEADSAALLIQTVVGFGSIIGRSAFVSADGSRHGMNLFAALVGESSKSRKGTSWQHVLRILERADEPWKQNCIANGLSSGEGVIWAVRDPITKTVKNKKTGNYENEVSDAGIDDKRLCVAEGEFANVLKVMKREGNTLSPVIRGAWDCGSLRSMTKNSEARATGAHVSIIGHITKDELRRLLTETESANGFGNRFLWLAVRRSKCLPEGGNMDHENLNDLVVRLHDAIQFARIAGEVTRSDGARELWHIVYPKLSEGKPGLLGAITARAEAQVLRLSAIYALLDCSTKIEVEHHRAALALWNYCERSASWIFSTFSGDLRADKILIALRLAGATGMTKTEISEHVFNRNLSADALADALRILHQSGNAKFVKETTDGAPCERWFWIGRATNLTN
jgi:5S rRNA maturation endonuclease (ribonuclease M5)